MNVYVACSEISFWNQAGLVIGSGTTVSIECNGGRLNTRGRAPLRIEAGAKLKVANCIFSDYLPGEGGNNVDGVTPLDLFGVEDGSIVEATNTFLESPCLVRYSDKSIRVL
jgi:hypothetical protein